MIVEEVDPSSDLILSNQVSSIQFSEGVQRGIIKEFVMTNYSLTKIILSTFYDRKKIVKT